MEVWSRFSKGLSFCIFVRCRLQFLWSHEDLCCQQIFFNSFILGYNKCQCLGVIIFQIKKCFWKVVSDTPLNLQENVTISWLGFVCLFTIVEYNVYNIMHNICSWISFLIVIVVLFFLTRIILSRFSTEGSPALVLSSGDILIYHRQQLSFVIIGNTKQQVRIFSPEFTHWTLRLHWVKLFWPL